MEMINKQRALVVEDLEIASRVAVLILNALGFVVDVAKNGAAAIQFAKQNKYELIFMDIGLPDIDGITVADNIRHGGKNSQTRIIALTANSDAEYRARSRAVGMQKFLIKPLTVDAVKQLLADRA